MRPPSVDLVTGDVRPILYPSNKVQLLPLSNDRWILLWTYNASKAFAVKGCGGAREFL